MKPFWVQAKISGYNLYTKGNWYLVWKMEHIQFSLGKRWVYYMVMNTGNYHHEFAHYFARKKGEQNVYVRRSR